MQTTTPTPIHYPEKCHHTNPLFPSAGVAVSYISFIFLSVIALLLSFYIRSITPDKYRFDFEYELKKAKINDTTQDIEQNQPGQQNDSAIPETAEDPSDQPPPYDSTSDPAAPPDIQPKKAAAKSSAERFVQATVAVVVMIFCLVCAGLAARVAMYCDGKKVDQINVGPLLFVVVWFFIFGLITSSGFMCWIMLLGDLWRPAPRQKYSFNDTLIMEYVGIALAVPIVVLVWFPLMGLWKGAIYLIEACQRKFCADALNNEELDEVELGVSGNIHDEENMSVAENETGMGEETEGLITGINKNHMGE